MVWAWGPPALTGIQAARDGVSHGRRHSVGTRERRRDGKYLPDRRSGHIIVPWLVNDKIDQSRGLIPFYSQKFSTLLNSVI